MKPFEIGGRKLSRRINAYFEAQDQCAAPFTVSGLACALGVSRAQLLCVPAYAGETQREAVAGALRRIEAYSEEQLFTGRGATGIIFSLKANFGWRELELAERRDELDLSGFSLNELRKIGGLDD